MKEPLEQFKTIVSEEQRHILSASAAAYYRLFIPEVLPFNIDIAIYLDCDLVLKGDLDRLWETDFQDNYILAVQDLWRPYVSHPVTALPYEKLGIPGDSKYFNSGVMVINLNKWRADEITAKTIIHFKQYFKYILAHDQGVLNALLANRWSELDPRWNLTPAIVDLFNFWQDSPFSQETYIIHFATEKKPSNSRHTAFKNAFFDYMDLTAWSGWRLAFWRRLKIKLAKKNRHILK